MATPNPNGTVDPSAIDVEANEETVLLDSAQPSPDPSEMTAASENEQLWAEFDRPWPATFERSVSLLASPVISFKEADLYTKSPKPGNTPLAARRFQVSVNIFQTFLGRLVFLFIYFSLSKQKLSEDDMRRLKAPCCRL
jgi:hypothetical protein